MLLVRLRPAGSSGILMFTYVDVLGFLAGFFTTIASVPQILKSFRTKSTKDLSIVFIGTIGFGELLWIGYGAALGSVPILAANVVSFTLAATLMALKLRYK